jgi:hypothetical protein
MLATFTVTDMGDAFVTGPGSAPGTLRQAIFDTNNTAGADVIEFASNLSGSIYLAARGDIDAVAGPSGFLISSPITIRGNSNGITITQATNNSQRLFRVDVNGDLSLESITLSGGQARGANGTIGQNGSSGMGGAIYNQGTLHIEASTLSSNAAIGGNGGSSGGHGGAGLGGAIYNVGTAFIWNSTLSGNSAASGSGSPAASSIGGAIYGLNGSIDIYNSTITNNTAAAVRDFFTIASNVGPPVNVRVYSSIIAHADAPMTLLDFNATAENGGQLIVAGANNLIRRQSDYAYITISTADPLLGSLSNNGGPTQTHALLAGSPAINLGSNLLSFTNDERGSPYGRTSGGTTDIGAFEVQQGTGDYNGNNVVDASDFVLWRKTQGSTVPQYSGADGSGNGTIDAADYELWRGNFGAIISAASASVEVSPYVSLNFSTITSDRTATRSPASTFDYQRERATGQVRDMALLAVLAEKRALPTAYFQTCAQANDSTKSVAHESCDELLSPINFPLNQSLRQTPKFAAASNSRA